MIETAQMGSLFLFVDMKFFTGNFYDKTIVDDGEFCMYLIGANYIMKAK